MTHQKIHWRCFHCNAKFTDRGEAAVHFGTHPGATPVCAIEAKAIRAMELELERHRNEDTELHREICRLQSEIVTRERRAEELGYARGLADAKKHPEELGLVRIQTDVFPLWIPDLYPVTD